MGFCASLRMTGKLRNYKKKIKKGAGLTTGAKTFGLILKLFAVNSSFEFFTS